MRKFAGVWIFAAAPWWLAAAHAGEAVPEPPAILLPAGVTLQKAGKEYVLADHRGYTLYTSAADGGGKSTCRDQCTHDWPPLPAPMLAMAKGDWSIVPREDGGRQWAYKGKPLYTSVKDTKAGETAGARESWTTAKP